MLIPDIRNNRDSLLSLVARERQKDKLSRFIPENFDLSCFALWRGARGHEDHIVGQLISQFDILCDTEIEWSREHYNKNLLRLYDRPIFNQSMKYDVDKKIGETPFRFIVTRDNSPEYRLMQNVSGVVEQTNIKAHRNKYSFRDLCSRPYQVHCSNNFSEFLAQATLVLGFESTLRLLSGETLPFRYLAKDLEGCSGWGNLNDLLAVLNVCSNYVLLRGVSADEPDTVKGDIDLLTDDFQKAASAMNLVQKEKKPFKGQVSVAGANIPIDLRYVGDGYFDKAWQRDMLHRKSFGVSCFELDPIDQLFSTIYHAFFHKPQVTHKYDHAIDELGARLSADWTNWGGRSEADQIRYIGGFMRSCGYSFEVPLDDGVKPQPKRVNQLKSKLSNRSGGTGLKQAWKKLKKRLPF